jgi:hypothetical protein
MIFLFYNEREQLLLVAISKIFLIGSKKAQTIINIIIVNLLKYEQKDR